ncbi:MAG: hypothetical protein JKY70_21485 [Mucilaginibacter sp.]|nr:hypothetical protein [Mucilaginibacter sp.]
MYSRREIFQIIFFLGSCFLSMNLISLYRHTIISPFVIPAIYLVAGLTGVGFYFKKMPQQHKNKLKDTLIKFAFCFVVGGGTCSWAFMSLNYYISGQPITKTTPIADRGGYMNSGRTRIYNLYVIIKYNNHLKEIPFDSHAPNGITGFNYVQFEVSRGLFGFEVIKNEALL